MVLTSKLLRIVFRVFAEKFGRIVGEGSEAEVLRANCQASDVPFWVYCEDWRSPAGRFFHYRFTENSLSRPRCSEYDSVFGEAARVDSKWFAITCLSYQKLH